MTQDTLFDITAEKPGQLKLLPTPVGADSQRGPCWKPRPQHKGGDLTLGGAVKLLPTPTTADSRAARTPAQIAVARLKGGCSNLRETVINDITQ